MSFITLTGLSEPNRPIRIRAERIDWIEQRRITDTKRPYEERSTFTAVGVGDASFMVAETPEEIDRLIKDAEKGEILRILEENTAPATTVDIANDDEAMTAEQYEKKLSERTQAQGESELRVVNLPD